MRLAPGSDSDNDHGGWPSGEERGDTSSVAFYDGTPFNGAMESAWHPTRGRWGLAEARGVRKAAAKMKTKTALILTGLILTQRKQEKSSSDTSWRMSKL